MIFQRSVLRAAASLCKAMNSRFSTQPGTSRATSARTLIADVGGTFARFALTDAQCSLNAVEVLRCDEFDGILEAIKAYLHHVNGPAPRRAGIAIATPVTQDAVRMTNHHWQFSIRDLEAKLALEKLTVVNDFVALAMSIPLLGAGQTHQIGPGYPRPGGTIAIVGPGTGLGVAGLIPIENGRWQALPSEGGHMSFAPQDDLELEILDFAQREFVHVSFERLVSGPGLALLYRALAALEGENCEALDASAIVGLAQSNQDPLASQAIALFCRIFGSFAANIALTMGAVGGVYLGGGMIDRLGKLFDHHLFRARFEAKGRYRTYLHDIPTSVICAPHPALLGMISIVNQY
jgi:glucokinase